MTFIQGIADIHYNVLNFRKENLENLKYGYSNPLICPGVVRLTRNYINVESENILRYTGIIRKHVAVIKEINGISDSLICHKLVRVGIIFQKNVRA